MSFEALIVIGDGHIAPAHRGSEELFSATMPGEYMVKVWKPRNLPHHRKFMGMAGAIADLLNNGPGGDFWDAEAVKESLKIGTGHCRLTPLGPKLVKLTGQRYAVQPTSIAFHRMDEEGFTRFHEEAIRYTLEHVVPWIPEGGLRQHIEEWCA